MNIRAVVFDLDGTLYPYRRIVLRSLPIVLRYPRFLRAFARARRRLRDLRPIANLHEAQAQLVSAQLGVNLTQTRELIEQLIYHDWPECFRGLPPFPGVAEVLNQLRRRGLRLAVLSDLPVHPKLDYLGLAGYWDCALTSETTNYLKPNPEPFRYAASQLEVGLESILFVGNSYPYDIQGAQTLGMTTAHLSRAPRRRPGADVTFSRFHSFLSAVEPLLG